MYFENWQIFLEKHLVVRLQRMMTFLSTKAVGAIEA
jgi:hypothetical protein